MDKQILIDSEGLNGYKLEIPDDRMMTESKLKEHFKRMNEELKKSSQGSQKSDKLTWMIDSYHDEWYLNNYPMVESLDIMSSGEIDILKSQMASYDEVKQRDYDHPSNKWETSLPSKETRLKNRKKRKSKK